MRAFVLFISIFTLLSASNVDNKIKSTKSKLTNSEKEYKSTHTKLNEVGKKLSNEIKKLDNISVDIEALSRRLKNSEEEIRDKKKELDEKTQVQNKLVERRKLLEIKLVEYLARDLSLSLVLKKTGNQDLKAIMQEEIFENYSSIIKKDTKLLIAEISKSKEIINLVQKEINILNRYIDNTNKKIDRLSNLKAKKKRLIASLKVQKSDYNKRLKDILKQKRNLATLLKGLKITQAKEQEKNENRQKEQIKEQKQELVKKESNTDIRQIGSSYQKAKTTNYKGRKYNPPLKKYKIVKKFGPYVDPVYNIKIFNNSVVLQSKLKNQKVRSVLSGKVVFAKETPTLKKVVIIKHKAGIHTIYAHLDDIVVANGKYVPTGYVVGRSSNELVFEVTKKDRYINPAQFLKLR
jgi:septal ring factor EnvC (AmiA/AmiB activator)